jgi:hypothetical protein
VDGPVRRSLGGGDHGGTTFRLAHLAGRDRRTAADAKVNKLDELIDRGADRLQSLAERAAADGGAKAKLADTLAEDAAFLRKLKPSLIAARARGEAPTNQTPGEGVVAPSAPQLGKRPKPNGGGPNPFLVLGVAFAAGILLAKIVDWRGHAHPRG